LSLLLFLLGSDGSFNLLLVSFSDDFTLVSDILGKFLLSGLGGSLGFSLSDFFDFLIMGGLVGSSLLMFEVRDQFHVIFTLFNAILPVRDFFLFSDFFSSKSGISDQSLNLRGFLTLFTIRGSPFSSNNSLFNKSLVVLLL
jgi:hypothetical protein